ncbi:uncharacterized protein LOC113472654 isoform X2 [Diaphorina citri]|uniref:Uncharacterized protein LOC113472654 isoform X2 n=1 Tax=Diaphorina citri TaxID=121845 RepID=A0A3Q0JM74_DIACI|nr:uncharacterized protein LOC113472654 isoform X2 [Diaphorina citri]
MSCGSMFWARSSVRSNGIRTTVGIHQRVIVSRNPVLVTRRAGLAIRTAGVIIRRADRVRNPRGRILALIHDHPPASLGRLETASLATLVTVVVVPLM